MMYLFSRVEWWRRSIVWILEAKRQTMWYIRVIYKEYLNNTLQGHTSTQEWEHTHIYAPNKRSQSNRHTALYKRMQQVVTSRNTHKYKQVDKICSTRKLERANKPIYHWQQVVKLENKTYQYCVNVCRVGFGRRSTVRMLETEQQTMWYICVINAVVKTHTDTQYNRNSTTTRTYTVTHTFW